MKIAKTLLLIFAICFSFFNAALSETRTPSLYNLLLKLENDLKTEKPKSVLFSDLSLIEKAKNNLPVSYIPELNYLMGSEVEKVPDTELTFMRKLIYYLYPAETALKMLLFLLLFYTFVFYFQNMDVHPFIRKVATVAGVFLLVASFIINYPPIVYATTAFGLTLLNALKRKRLSVYMLVTLTLLFVFQVVNYNAYLRLKSRNISYLIKVSRDGYAPDYLIGQVFPNKKEAILEKVTSHLSLGKLDSVLLLKNLKFQDPFHNAVVLNDVGYANFLQGNYKKALYFFENALRTYSSPEIEYNLYLTYSSLLKFEKAKALKRELLRKGIPIEKLHPVPVLIHLSVSTPGYSIPFKPLLGLVIGILAGIIFSHFFVVTFGNFDPQLLLIPGMREFINSRIRPLILIALLTSIINIVLGRVICSV